MDGRSTIYLVQSEGWYVERAGWGVAGLVGGLATAAAAAGQPLGLAAIAAIGLTSVVNALTGFCPVSTALQWSGLPPRLSGPRPGRVYRMRTDRWYLERTIYAVVGVNLTLASVLAAVHSPWWLAFTGFVSVAAITFAFTGFCPVANVLYHLGLEPRLARAGSQAPVRDRPPRRASLARGAARTRSAAPARAGARPSRPRRTGRPETASPR